MDTLNNKTNTPITEPKKKGVPVHMLIPHVLFTRSIKMQALTGIRTGEQIRQALNEFLLKNNF